MDLRGMLNDNGPAAAAAAAAASSNKQPKPQQMQVQTQPQPQLQPQPGPPLPSTPIQTMPQQPFRDYGQTQQSPSRQYSQDYAGQHAGPGAFASSPFQGGAGQYPSRPPQPPPLQQIPSNDLRSPSIGSGPTPSPYRPTPTSSISTASGGYPFPPPQQTPTSPVQRHQYPPTSAFHRDGYSQPSGAVGMTGPPGAASYMQGPPLPQTPPIGAAGGPHPYPHQRSQSSQSTATPTSAQSQPGQYGASFVHGSPVATTHPLPHMDHQQRQSSQPPTPIAGPLSAGPRQTQTLNFGQPPSPYQQRLSSTTAYHALQAQTSPPPPPPPSLPRHPSSQSVYEPHGQDPNRRPQSRSERDRSVSISPKTRVPSLPSSVGRPATSVSDTETRQPQPLSSTSMGLTMDIDRGRDTPAKRKLEDLDLRPDELERRDVHPPAFEKLADRSKQSEPAQSTYAPLAAKRQRRRMVHRTPPVWAQPARGRQLTNPNCILYRPAPHHSRQVNGKSESVPSRHTSPEERRSTLVAQPVHPPPPAAQPAPQQAPEPLLEDAILGPWEPSITNTIPQGSISKTLCDFFFKHVILNENLDEILQSRGVKFEIEAKLGTLISKHSNQRVTLPILTDCVLDDDGGLAFRSSMTEAQHKSFNDFLNSCVMASHPDNKANVGNPRVPVKYLHRREIDKFFELPPNIRDQTLPHYVANPIISRGHSAKVRVTYEQKTKEVLAKIIKTRIADINLHFPQSRLDCRISVNLEMDWDGPVDSLENMGQLSNRPPPPDRMKDRLSYTHGLYQVDLTQVTQVDPNGQQKEHELEVELSPAQLIEQGRLAQGGGPHKYVELIEGFFNNISVLARKACEFSP